MKRLFCIILLVTASMSFVSCEKTGGIGNSKVVGEWLHLNNEVFLDGKSVATNIQAVSTNAEDLGYGILYFTSHQIFGPWNLTFTAEGYVIAMGANIGTYTYSDDKVYIADYSIGTIEKGVLTEVWTLVNSGPQYVQIDYEEDKTYQARKIEVVTTYKKLK